MHETNHYAWKFKDSKNIFIQVVQGKTLAAHDSKVR
jgi:hypothetical protein